MVFSVIEWGSGTAAISESSIVYKEKWVMLIKYEKINSFISVISFLYFISSLCLSKYIICTVKCKSSYKIFGKTWNSVGKIGELKNSTDRWIEIFLSYN